MATPAYVEPLATASPDPDRLGGKGASLARLVQLGFRVPVGLVVTIDAFAATILDLCGARALARLGERLAVGDDLTAGSDLREPLLAGRIPPAILEPVLQALDELGLLEDKRERLIVRSSATGEDTFSHSFAGIFESLTTVGSEGLEPAIRQVWASAFSPRALTYVRERGLTAVPGMAVVVQRFLDADRSGVMFTEFPATGGERRILVEHVEGGCEKLVKGEVTPDRLWLAKSTPDATVDGGALPAAHAMELARLASGLEKTFGEPQDVEWVIHGGAVHVVQSRPVTAAFAPAGGSRFEEGGAAALLTGVAASPGTGAGPVHLVFNIEHALALERGEVLVTPMTNPDMVVAMGNSAAIVTDVGGMICHAAIVSRELGLPCVVGTETATSSLVEDQAVTVDGWAGAVYGGVVEVSPRAEATPASWKDLWTVWQEAAGGRTDVIPVVSSVAAFRAMPPGPSAVVLVPDLDLRADRVGLWNDLEALADEERAGLLDGYVQHVALAARERGVSRVYLRPLGTLDALELAGAAARSGGGIVKGYGPEAPRPSVALDPGGGWPEGPIAAPLGSAAAVRARQRSGSASLPSVGGMEEARAAALDTIRFFGHQPGVKVAGMPDSASRRRWWALLPEYGRFHAQSGTEREHGEFEWLEVRPELVISALLKSLVQPGFEMVPRVLGFPQLPPMHIKWIRCRYHFRSDAFTAVWRAIVQATWDEGFMADLMRRVRASYDALADVMVLFPRTDRELADLNGERIVARLTSWWPRWVEFFSLCWFIQAQGDDIAYPFVEETVRDNLDRIGPPPDGLAWPSVTDLIAPTTPVMSAEYMADVDAMREALLAAGLTSVDQAERELARGEHPEVADRVRRHLGKWHWMRDRDLLFEPWDTPRRVIETALRTEPHGVPSYEENLRRNLLALSFHVDLAHASGRADGLHHAARFLHDLNVERENHHILWLKHSYPVRRLVLEIERRLVGSGSLAPGDVFFLQAPELIEAARHLPAPLPAGVAARARNRRAAFLQEARLPTPESLEGVEPQEEDDYY